MGLINFTEGKTLGGAAQGFEDYEQRKANKAKGLADLADTKAGTALKESQAGAQDASAEYNRSLTDKNEIVMDQLKQDYKYGKAVKELEMESGVQALEHFRNNPHKYMATLDDNLEMAAIKGDEARYARYAQKTTMVADGLGGIMEVVNTGGNVSEVSSMFQKFAEQYEGANGVSLADEFGIEIGEDGQLTNEQINQIKHIKTMADYKAIKIQERKIALEKAKHVATGQVLNKPSIPSNPTSSQLVGVEQVLSTALEDAGIDDLEGVDSMTESKLANTIADLENSILANKNITSDRMVARKMATDKVIASLEEQTEYGDTTWKFNPNHPSLRVNGPTNLGGAAGAGDSNEIDFSQLNQ